MRLLKALWIVVSLLVAPACLVREIEEVPPNAEIVEGVPPPLRLEVIPVAPSAGHLWIPGHWAWHRAWIWEPGRYEQRRLGYAWYHGRWIRHRHGWVWIEGRWGRV